MNEDLKLAYNALVTQANGARKINQILCRRPAFVVHS